RVRTAVQQADAVELLDQRAHRVRRNAQLERRVLDAHTRLSVDEPQQLALGMRDVERLARRAGAIAQAAANAAEDFGQLGREAGRSRRRVREWSGRHLYL